ncbi:MAG: Alpha/beta-hydrolase [Aureobasidium pullulans]|nr:MAG: Alpha/beta-hydrolase [Aureobasidium pullulans]
MAPVTSHRLIEATFKYPINANSNPTPVKTPSQEAYTQVARSPVILRKPRYIVPSQEDIVQDSVERHSPKPAHQPKSLPNLFEATTPVDNDQTVRDSQGAKSVVSDPPSQNQPSLGQQRSVEAHLSDQGLSENNLVDHSIEANHSAHSPSENVIQNDTVQPQTFESIESQKDVALRESLKVQRVEHIRSDDNEHDEHDEDIADCIQVRIPPSPKIDSTKSSTGDISASRQDEEIDSKTSLNPTGTSQRGVSATTAPTTPSMAPKASISKGTSKSKTPANQSQKRASQSRSSQQPNSEITNRGETSATVLLRQMRAGATSQNDVRRQVLIPALPHLSVAPTKPSQKASARPSQATIKKPSVKISRQNQDKSQDRSRKLPKRQESRNREPSDDAIDEYAVPQSGQKRFAKPLQKIRPAAPSVPPVSKGKSQSKRQTVNAPETDEDDDDDDEVYKAPKTNTSKAGPEKRETRSSTRLQTGKITKDTRLNVPTRNTTNEAAKKVEKAEKPVPRQPPTSRVAKAQRVEELEDFEDSVTHANSDRVAKLQPAVRPRTAIPPAEQRKPRPVTDKGAKLMHAISSPSQTVPAATSVATKTKKKAPAAEHRFSTPAEKPIGEQGTTQRHPITVDDDGDDSDDDDAVNAAYQDDYDELVTHEMSQEEPAKQDRPKLEEPSIQSPFTLAQPKHLVGERDSRKTNIIGFDGTGPKNQGVSHQKHTGSNLPLPFEENTSSPDNYNAHESPVDTTTYYDDTPLMKPLESDRAAKVPIHVSTVGEVASVELGDSALSKPPSTKTVVSVEVSRSYDMAPPPVPKKAVVTGSEREPVEGTHVRLEEKRQKEATPQTRSEAAKSLAHSPSQSPIKQSDAPPRKPQGEENATKLSGALSKGRTSTGSQSRNEQVAPNSKRPDVQKPQNSTAQKDPVHATRPAQKQPKQDRLDQAHAEPVSNTRVAMIIPNSDHTPEAIAGKDAIGLGLNQTGRPQSRSNQADKPALHQKRLPVAMTKEPAKRQRTNAQGSRQPTALPTTAANPLIRKLSQVADNGSPIPFGEEIPPETDVRRTRHGGSSLLPPIVFAEQLTVDPFAQIIASKQRRNVRQETPLEELPNMHQDWPVQVSQAVTHAGFEGETQLSASFAQASEPERRSQPGQQKDLVRTANVPQKSLGLLNTLRSEVIPQADVQDEAEREKSEEASQADEAMEEDDPDKTLVNEISDDEDGDDSESGDSSDSDDSGEAYDPQSLWRKALDSHQGHVYDQLVRIAHRLTVHLKDHETAIEDTSKDYRQDGEKLIDRFEKDNEERLEQYRIRASKMKGALVLGFRQVSGTLHKDMKDITVSSDRYGKMLQKQVDAGGRLKQIMQAYHP